MKPIEIIAGIRFGKLMVIKESEPIFNKSGNKIRMIECKCDCGNIKTTRLTLLRSNQTTSCGCFHKQKISSIFKKHGDSLTPEYICWNDMLKRCNNINNKAYKHYGARGIKVDKSFNKWENFKEYLINTIGLRPSNKYSLDRINNDGNYEPDNIRWTTQSEQLKNRRKINKLNQ